MILERERSKHESLLSDFLMKHGKRVGSGKDDFVRFPEPCGLVEVEYRIVGDYDAYNHIVKLDRVDGLEQGSVLFYPATNELMAVRLILPHAKPVLYVQRGFWKTEAGEMRDGNVIIHAGMLYES